MATALRTLIARNDESFSFIYQENIDRLENVSFFDPERDVPNLDDVELLYLPGGYPEKHLDALVAAEATRRAIKEYAECGGRIIAECGGMMYLCEKIVTDEGELLHHSPQGRPQTLAGLSPFHPRWQGIPRTRVPLHAIHGRGAAIGGSGL